MRQTHYAKNEGAEAPAGVVCRGFCLATDPLTVAKEGYRRIDDRAVSGVGKRENGTYRPDLCL